MNDLLSNPTQLIPFVSDLGMTYLPKIIIAFLVFWLGKRIARWVVNITTKLMRRNDVEEELIGFLDSIMYWGLVVLVCITALSQLGIQTASFIAVLGAAGLAIGLALQGSLSNFAAGVLIIVLRPFKVEDFVEMAGQSGTVKNIKIFVTELRTGDNKCVIIPNSRVLDSNIINYSSTGRRRVDLVFGIGYDDDIDKARAVINEILKTDERVLTDPEPVIAVSQLADSSVNFVVRPWVNSADYWKVFWDTTESVKKRFDEEDITIPFPQRTLHIENSTKDADKEQIDEIAQTPPT